MRRDYSATPLPKKLGLTDESRAVFIHPPDGFVERAGVAGRARGRVDVVVFFTKSKAELERRFGPLVRRLAPAGGLWISWPKKSAKVATDLSFDEVQKVGLAEGLVDNKSCSIDDTWQAVRFVIRREDRPVRAGARRSAARSARPHA